MLIHERIASFLPLFDLPSRRSLDELVAKCPLEYLRVKLSFSHPGDRQTLLLLWRVKEVVLDVRRLGGWETLSAVLRMPSVVYLSVGFHWINPSPSPNPNACFAELVSQSIASANLRHYFKFCVSVEAVEADVARLLRQNHRLVGVAFCGISKRLQSFLGGAGTFTLAHLSLRDCHLKPESVVRLAKALRMQTQLQVLDMSDNARVGDHGIGALSVALSGNRSLKHLGLSHMEITAQGAMLLAQALRQNETLQIFEVVDPITATGVLALLDMLRTNRALKHVIIADTSTSRRVRPDDVSTALEQNRELKELIIDIGLRHELLVPAQGWRWVDVFVGERFSRGSYRCKKSLMCMCKVEKTAMSKTCLEPTYYCIGLAVLEAYKGRLIKTLFPAVHGFPVGGVQWAQVYGR